MNIDITNALKVTGWMKPTELRWLAEQASKCERILEVGSYHGRSTIAMLDNSYADIWCVDSWNTKEIHESDYRKFFVNVRPYGARVTIMRGEGEEMLRRLKQDGELFDMAFVDDGHAYEFAYADIFNSLPLVKQGGLICGHDFSPAWPGVVKAVKELVLEYRVQKGTAIWWKVV